MIIVLLRDISIYAVWIIYYSALSIYLTFHSSITIFLMWIEILWMERVKVIRARWSSLSDKTVINTHTSNTEANSYKMSIFSFYKKDAFQVEKKALDRTIISTGFTCEQGDAVVSRTLHSSDSLQVISICWWHHSPCSNENTFLQDFSTL